MEDREDEVTAEKLFLDKFSESRAALAAEEDAVHYRVGSPSLAEHDFEGEVTDWALQYLYAHKCPYNLAAAVAYATCQEIKSSDLQSIAHQNGQTDEAVFDSNKLLKLVHRTVHDICERWMATPTKAVHPPTWPVAITAVKNGRRRMEDRHVVISDLGLLYGVQCPSPRGFFAVFDGHAGPDAATYAAAHLHHNIVRQPTFVTNIVQAIKDGFQLTDDHFICKSKQENLKSGSTAVCAIVEEDEVHVAWLGDSQAILARQGGALNLVTPHKPERADERERIERLGGCVMLFGTWRVNGTLAVSRAIGDAEFKPYVSAEPDVVSIPRDGTEDFLIVACDGLWDVMSGQDAANIVYACLVKKPDDLEGAAHKLVQLSVSRGSNDNISVIVVLLRDVANIVASMSCIPESPPATFRIPLATSESLPEGLKQMIENGESPTKIMPLPDIGLNEQFTPGSNTLNPFAPSFTPSSARNGTHESLYGGDLLDFCNSAGQEVRHETSITHQSTTIKTVPMDDGESSSMAAQLWISDAVSSHVTQVGNVPTVNPFASSSSSVLTSSQEFQEYFLAQSGSQTILDMSTVPSVVGGPVQPSTIPLSSFDSKSVGSPTECSPVCGDYDVTEARVLSVDIPIKVETNPELSDCVPSEKLLGDSSPLLLPSPPTQCPMSPNLATPPPIPERPPSLPPLSPSPLSPKSPSQISTSPPPIPSRSQSSTPEIGLPPTSPLSSPPPIPARSPSSISTPPLTPSSPKQFPADSLPHLSTAASPLPPIPAVSPMLADSSTPLFSTGGVSLPPTPTSPLKSPPIMAASLPPVSAASPPPVAPASPPPVAPASPPPVTPASPPPVAPASPPPVAPASPPPVLAASPPPVLAASPPPVLAASPPPVLAASPPPVLAASPPPVLAASPPPVLAASPPPVLAASPPPATPASPPPATPASPPPATPASPPPATPASPPPATPASPPPATPASPPPATPASPPPATPASPPPATPASPPPATPASPPPATPASPPPATPASPPPATPASPPPATPASPPPIPARSPGLFPTLPLSSPPTSPTAASQNSVVTSSPLASFESVPPLDINVQQSLLESMVEIIPQSSNFNSILSMTEMSVDMHQTEYVASHVETSQNEPLSMDPITVEIIPETVPVSDDVVDDESEDGDGWRYFQGGSRQDDQKISDTNKHEESLQPTIGNKLQQKEETEISADNSAVLTSSPTHTDIETSFTSIGSTSAEHSHVVDVQSALFDTSSEGQESGFLILNSSATEDAATVCPASDHVEAVAELLPETQSALLIDTSAARAADDKVLPPASSKSKETTSTTAVPKLPKEKGSSNRETLKKTSSQTTKEKQLSVKQTPAAPKTMTTTGKSPATTAKTTAAKSPGTQATKTASASKTLERKPQTKPGLPPTRGSATSSTAPSSSLTSRPAARPASATTRKEAGNASMSRQATPGTNSAGTLPKRPASAGTMPRTAPASKPLSNGVKKTTSSAKPATANEVKSSDANTTAKSNVSASRSLSQTKTVASSKPATSRPPAAKKSAAIPGTKSDTVLVTATANKLTKETVNKQISTTVRQTATVKLTSTTVRQASSTSVKQTTKTTTRPNLSSRTESVATANGTLPSSKTARLPGHLPTKEASKKSGNATLPSSGKVTLKKAGTAAQPPERKATTNARKTSGSSDKMRTTVSHVAGTSSSAAKGDSDPPAAAGKMGATMAVSEKGALDEQAKEPLLQEQNQILDHGDELVRTDVILTENGSVIDSVVGFDSGDPPSATVVSTQEMV